MEAVPQTTLRDNRKKLFYNRQDDAEHRNHNKQHDLTIAKKFNKNPTQPQNEFRDMLNLARPPVPGFRVLTRLL